ncbi:MAG: hypothetical protein RBU37_17445, partial [Myxococcota bacterium]|nr:hypothetical protein [Myxococcota bacterium]
MDLLKLCVSSAALLVLSCGQDEPSEPPALHANTAVTATAQTAAETVVACDDAHSLWELGRDGTWARRCLDAPLIRDTAAWTYDGTRLIGLGPQGCTGYPDPLFQRSVSGQHVETVETKFNSYFVNKGASITTDDQGNVHTYGGELCLPYNSGLHAVLFADGGSKHEIFGTELVWPVVFPREDKVLVSSGLALREGNLDVATYPGLDFEPNPYCWFIHPDGVGEHFLPRFCGRKKGEFVPEARKKGTWFFRAQRDDEPSLPPGRELSWVYDRKRDRLVSLAFFEPSMWSSELMDPTPLLWRVDRRAWSIPKQGAVAQLPDPPVVGDGVSLLYDPTAEQVILFDPFGTKSWALAADDSAWEEYLTHASVPLPEGITLPDNTRGTEHRFTQWWAPYFAYWDLERGAPTLL